MDNYVFIHYFLYVVVASVLALYSLVTNYANIHYFLSISGQSFLFAVESFIFMQADKFN